LAKLVRNTIDPVAVATDDGRHLIVAGPVVCQPAGERLHTRVTVTQRTTGGIAEGGTLDRCTGEDQEWEVHAPVRGERSFEEGPATAVAVARTIDRGEITDAHQWLVNITLVEE
jgi:hypothetical protein